MELAMQASIAGLFEYDEVRGVMVNEVVGVYTVEAALAQMLANTDLEGEVNERGVLTARLRQAEEEGEDEEDASAFTGFLEEIIVTARRREENLMKTPVSITAFTQAELKARQIDQVYQVGNATPNMVWRRQSVTNNAGAVVHIRGVGQDLTYATRQPGVALYADGVYIAQMSSAFMDVMDIQSIEVLRGPQGTLFGRNSIGGAVQINTVKPNDEFGGEIEALAGRFDRWQVKGSVNVPFSNALFGKFSASWQEKDGFVDTPRMGGDGKGGDDNVSARAALRWAPTGALTVDLALDYFDHESGGPPSVLAAPINEFNGVPGGGIFTVDYNTIVAPALGLPLALNRDFFVPPDQYTSMQAPAASFGPGISDSRIVGEDSLTQRNEWKSASLTVKWDINDRLMVKTIANYRELENESNVDLDEMPAPVAYGGDFYDGDQASVELQLSGTAFDQRMEWVAGFYYFEEQVTSLNPVDFPLFHLMSGAIVDNTSMAFFGQFTCDVTDKLSLTLGLRNTDEELDSIVDDSIHFVYSFLSGPPVNGFAPVPLPPDPFAFKILANGTFSSNANETEPYVNVAYNFTDRLLGYVSYSEGFKGGGFTQAIAPGLTIDSFAPEFAKVVEVGAKWSGERLRMSVAGFYNDYTDLQVNTNRVLGGSTENAASAEITGGEFELAAALTEQLQVSLGVGYLDGEYKDVDLAVVFDPGNRLPNVMDWQVNASASYRLPLGPGELIARLDYVHSDDYFVEAENEPDLLMPSCDLLNGSLTYVHESDKWEVALQGSNITDEFYTTFGVGTPATSGTTIITLGPPAEWTVRFKYRF